jgi:hypothetical protein
MSAQLTTRMQADPLRIFRRPEFDSEGERQEAIGKRANSIASALFASLAKNDAEALEVAQEMGGHILDEEMMRLMRYALSGEFKRLQLELMGVTLKAVERIADHRAIKEIERGE